LAWDFEIEDTSGKKYSDHQESLSDYYCYGKAVYAAAAGYVSKMVNSIPDNPIGDVNTVDNWGNYVSINHGYGFYTLYAHLKEGSIKLAEGDYIKMGEKLGLVGNSGRSFVPHLHFQAQAAIDAGSRTVFRHIINYKVLQADGSYRFEASGIPEEGDKSPPWCRKRIWQIPQSAMDRQDFQVKDSRGHRTRMESGADLLGNTVLYGSGTILDFSVYHGISML
jgi:murein DD-endopeptidase MepM/ murein hydrolase activator NlpD